MFSAIISSLGGVFIDKIIGGALDAFKAYQNKQISLEELRSQMVAAALVAAKDIETSHADALAKTYSAFMDAMKTSRLMQVMWALTVGTQLFVLFWHQIGIPAVAFFLSTRYPSSGETVNWAYLLLGACLGLGPLVLRSGPGAMSTDKIKSIMNK